jgi:dTDP-4-dehydrorhamnose 3,5-epimerase
MGFRFTDLEIPGVVLVETDAFQDDRGAFLETYRDSVFRRQGFPRFVQDNRSHSRQGVLRGIHYQLPPYAQGKLVGAVSGRILDVAVDLRRDQPTYRQWLAVELSDANHRLLYVPEGFGHAFLVLSDHAIVAYKVTAEYAPAADRGIRWDDPAIGIAWPMASPELSPKDQRHPTLGDAEHELPATKAGWLLRPGSAN